MNVPGEKEARPGTTGNASRIPDTPEELTDISDPVLRSQLIYFFKLGKLTAGLMHDLNNRLAIARGFLDYVVSDPDMTQSERQKCLQAALGSINDSIQIMESAKGMAPEQDLNIAPCSINRITKAALQKVKKSREFDLKRIQISTDYDSPLPKVKIDAILMERVFMNLIRNACQAMLEEGGKLVIKTLAADGWVYIRVRDSGPGLPDSVLQNLGMPFNTTRIQNGGTGLGLMVASDIVRAHRGSLAAHNLPFGGAEFVIALPLRDDDPD